MLVGHSQLDPSPAVRPVAESELWLAGFFKSRLRTRIGLAMARSWDPPASNPGNATAPIHIADISPLNAHHDGTVGDR
jgi:hypothetical protein